jgi:SAM-dependent methyltransferase
MLPFAHIDRLRMAELASVLPHLPPGARILEVGAGSGRQALALQQAGFEVAAIDLPSSDYADNHVFPVADYDGARFPYGDASFDVVFSSNVLEHVPDLAAMHAEIRRVLARDGQCFHILPTHRWRFWTSLAAFPAAVRDLVMARSGRQLERALRHGVRAFVQKRHGERGNALTELYYFRPAWWRRNFVKNGFAIVRETPARLFYTGEALLGERLSMERRGKLSSVLGSACVMFQLRATR